MKTNFAQYLITEENDIHREITESYINATNESWAITDGLVEPQQYAISRPRILWILKEPYDEGTERKGGGWSLTKDLLFERTDEMSRKRAFQPICYITHGIHSGVSDWDKMEWLRDSHDIRHSIRKIAFINVSKLPGLKTSSDALISIAYQKYRPTILRQIQVYAPDLIFACNPHVHIIAKDLGVTIDADQWQSFGTAAAVMLPSGQRLVWVYHPSQRKRGVTRVSYVNNAIQAATAVLRNLI